MREQTEHERIIHAVDARLSGLPDDPWLTRRVLERSKGEQKVKKKLSLGLVIVLALLVGLAAVGYAAFSSQVVEFFGRFYGQDTGEWLEQGQVALPAQSFTMDGVVFALEEVVYRDNSLYGVGSIRPAEGGKDVLIPDDDWSTEDAYGLAQAAKERGGRLLCAGMRPGRVGVDEGELLGLDTVGLGFIPRQDGSIHVSFELSDSMAVSAGTTYTLAMEALLCEVTPEGKRMDATEHRETWTVVLKPGPAPAEALPVCETAALEGEPTQPQAEKLPYQLHVPLEYTQTGTLPIYKATARDFSAVLRPELFNRSGIAEQSEYGVTFQDGALLQWGPEAVFYNEFISGSEWVQTLKCWVADLASDALRDNLYSLEATTLTEITLDKAQATVTQLLDALGMSGYTCDTALDMSIDRIVAMGSKWNAQRDAGYINTNLPHYDLDKVTTADEGYFLSYHKLGQAFDQKTGDRFSVYAYVTAKGIVRASIRDYCIPAEVYDTPAALIPPQAAVDALPDAIRASRYPDMQALSITDVALKYEPMRAPNKKDGMVLSPVWLVIYQDCESNSRSNTGWAAFDAVTGKLFDAAFR